MSPSGRPQPPSERKSWPSRLSKPLGSLCDGCVLQSISSGFVHARGPASPIVLLAEAPGPEELKSGIPMVGPAGSMLERLFRMIGKDLAQYRIDNTIRCLPPGMELAGQSYAPMAIQRCRYRDESICQPTTKVIVTLGSVATRALLDRGKGAAIEDLHGTVHRWQNPYTGAWTWVVPTYHPSHLQRGAHNLIGTVLFDLLLAHEVAADGWAQDPGVIVEDPPLDWFTLWVDGVVAGHRAAPGSFWVTNDIETPDKAGGKSEGELGPDDASYQILRQNFSCNPDEGVTVPYVGGYIEQCERLFRAANEIPDRPLPFLYWNEDYDRRRNAAAGHTLPEVSYDGMEMAHLLQSDVPRGLGHWAPYYSKFGAWKHLAASRPAYYGGVDGLQNQRTVYGAAADLVKQGQWDVYLRHRVQVRKYALRPSEDVGLKLDEVRLDKFIVDMTDHARRLFGEIQAVVPDTLRPLVGNHKRRPEGVYTKATDVKKDGTKKKDPLDPLKMELFQQAEVVSRQVSLDVQVCRVCGAVDIAKTHRCEESRSSLWATPDGKLAQAIVQIEARTVERWFWKEPFNPDSRDQVMAYVKWRGHTPGKAKKTHAETVDRKTLERLWKASKDPFYKLNMDLRSVVKVRGTYGIGMKKRLRNGRVHGRITWKASTQRTTSVDPNLQNVVADKGAAKQSLAAGFRHCVVAEARAPAWVTQDIYDRWCDDWGIPRMPVAEDPGCVLLETDFSGIEAKIIGWCAQDPFYVRLAGLGPHACLALYAIGQPPDLSLPDAELKALFKTVKDSGGPPDDPILYDRSKRVCHGSAYGLTAHGMASTFDQFFSSVKQAEKLLAIFYNQMAPKIRDFHKSVRLQAQRDYYLGGTAHPYRYKHWFWSVLQYRMITAAQAMTRKKNGGWVETINGRDFAVDWGDDSKRAIAFFPQSIAAGILMEALLGLFLPWLATYIGHAYYGQTGLRAPIHDSLLQEIPRRIVQEVLRRVLQVKTAPVQELPLPPEWNMGTHLTIGVDAKAGADWGSMEALELEERVQLPATVSDAPTFIEDEEDDEMVDSLNETVMGERRLVL